MMKRLMTVPVLMLVAAAVFAQVKPRLAILPFTGGSPEDAETIAEFFSFEDEINRVFIPVPRTRAIENLMKEQEFQRSGLTDSDTIAELGKQLNADYVLAGHIAALGDSKLLLITIINVNELRQIAGDYREYRRIESVIDVMPDMAKRIGGAATRRVSGLPGLAVLPFNALSSGVNQQDAEILAQLLATEIANSGHYAVYPRTKAIEKVMEEHHIEQSGMTDRESMKAIGEAVNAQYVLSANVRRLGEDNYFSASILHIVEASQGKGTREKYQTVADGLTLMPKIAQTLTFDAATAAGFMYDVGNGIAIITDYAGSAKDVVIPNQINGLPVAVIGANAFREKQLTSVTIPDSVTAIGESAFYKNRLTSVTIPGSVTEMGNSAFSNNQLTSVTISNGVTAIGVWAFGHNQLTSVTIPNSVATIGDAAFSDNQLTSATIPNSVTAIGSSAFDSNQLTSVTIPNSVTTIGDIAFWRNRLTSVTIPNGVITIGDGAFRDNQLTSVTLPNSVTAIGRYAFSDNRLTSVTIGNKVTSIGQGAFSDNQLTSVTIPGSVTEIGKYAFAANRLTRVTIPNGVTTIGDSAFSSNQLTSVTIPNSVTSIGQMAFYSNRLTSVTIGANVTIGIFPFDGDLLDVYTQGGRRAGTYTSSDSRTWRRQ
jgi:TolB-like protein